MKNDVRKKIRHLLKIPSNESFGAKMNIRLCPVFEKNKIVIAP